MSEKKKHTGNYNGTLLPEVGKLINKCKGQGTEYRIVSEDFLKTIKGTDTADNMLLTIVVDVPTGKLIRTFHGKYF